MLIALSCLENSSKKNEQVHNYTRISVYTHFCKLFTWIILFKLLPVAIKIHRVKSDELLTTFVNKCNMVL
jgi:hypothetical protein